ncbi:unnamed protein product [Rangifer tarandus platyrhynchus]|uniref:Uncharacterized protein n=1 Tax=Rangifer tarandus platyrhynchus TaxID=3082113 RepID=A0ABN8Z840_RANTA|nr:unnamed protein product [Rangifer tarandus platyrhynchus]CAI9688418.1 unnamed protein product [Rangifer tarandus platyrhynchus]
MPSNKSVAGVTCLAQTNLSVRREAGGPAVGPHRLPRLGGAGGRARSCGRPAVRTWRDARDVPAHGGPGRLQPPGPGAGTGAGRTGSPDAEGCETRGRHLGGPTPLPNSGPHRASLPGSLLGGRNSGVGQTGLGSLPRGMDDHERTF